MIDNNRAKEIRKEFPIFDQEIVYLDNAATTQKPKQVIEAMNTFYAHQNANIHRSVYPLSAQATQLYDQARAKVAKFIGAAPEEIIFTKSTTESINLVASTISPILQGNQLVVSEIEHHANLIPWQELSKRSSMQLEFISLNDHSQLSEPSFTNDTALVALTHLSNAIGVAPPVSAYIKQAHAHDALVLIDAAQTIGKQPINVHEMDCDFLVFSSHKMLGPMGVGVLYIRKEILDRLEPYQFGGDMIEQVEYDSTTYAQGPQRFEAGTPNVGGVLGLAAAIEYLENIGLDQIHDWEKKLHSYCVEKLQNVQEVTLYSRAEGEGIITFALKGAHAHDVASLLGEKNICVRSGHHCAMPLMKKLGVEGLLRVSFHMYNTYEDVDRFIEELQKVIEVFR